MKNNIYIKSHKKSYKKSHKKSNKKSNKKSHKKSNKKSNKKEKLYNGGSNANVEAIYSSPIQFYPELAISDIFNEKDNNLFDFVKSVIEFKSGIKEEEYNKHIIGLCKTLNYYNSLLKNNYENGIKGFEKISSPTYLTNPNPLTEILIFDLHGEINTKLFQLPTNINLVFLSPVKYITCNIIDKFISQLEKTDILKDYLKDPSCYNKSNFDKFFKKSVIYYGGQYCIDLNISRSENEYSNLFKLDGNTFTNFVIENIPTLPQLPDFSKNEYHSTLSSLLQYLQTDKYRNKQFTIFLPSCREFNSDNYIKKIHNIFTFYENIIKITNFKAQYKNKDNTLSIDTYKKCVFSPTNFYDNKLTNLSHEQFNRNNINISINTIRSSSKINISNESKIFTKVENFPDNYLNKYNNVQNNSNIKYTTLGELKTFILQTATKFDKFNNILNILKDFLEKNDFKNSDYNRTFYNNNYNINIKIIIFIFNNNIQLAFECLLFILANLYISKNYLYYFIKNYNPDELVNLSNLKLETIKFLFYYIDEILKFKIKILDLSYNNLNDLNIFKNINNKPSIGYYTFSENIEIIFLNNNNITIFPIKLLEFKNLREIYLDEKVKIDIEYDKIKLNDIYTITLDNAIRKFILKPDSYILKTNFLQNYILSIPKRVLSIPKR